MKKLYLALLLVLFTLTAAFAEVNINTADKTELTSLPGIGPVKAEAIIQYRKDKGPFKELSEIKNVYGIGDKTFERLKSQLTIASDKETTTVERADQQPLEEAAPTEEETTHESTPTGKTDTKQDEPGQ